MTIRRGLTSIILCCCVVQLACAWPWPRSTEDTTGLGKSEIAKILSNICCAPTEWLIAEKIQIALGKADKGLGPRAGAESIGFTCDSPPSQTCRYAGERKYQLYGVPKGNPEAEKIHILSYSIVLLDYADTKNIWVEQTTTIVP